MLICAAILAIVIFSESSLGWRLRMWLSPKPTAQGDTASLEAKNLTLQAEVARLQGIINENPKNPGDEIRAMAYVQYPFGFKNEVLLDAGTTQGVAVGKTVTFQGIFLGSVTDVFPKNSVVQTIFDPTFKMPVRIGNDGYDALLVGGPDPKATSIAKKAALQSGDIVYAAASGFPYGLPIGIVNTTSTSGDNLFMEASISLAYNINDVQSVLIER